MPARCAVVAQALTLAAGALAAHDTWLLPTTFLASSGDTVMLHLTSGTGFPANETAISAGCIREAAVRLAGRTTAITARPRRTLRSSCAVASVNRQRRRWG